MRQKMRLGIDFGGDLIKLGLEKGLRMVKEAGFDGVDYNMQTYQLGDDYQEIAKEVRMLLDEIGLCCIQTHAPHNFVFGTAMNFSNQQYRETFRSIEFTRILGAEKCVIHGSPVPDGPLSGQFMEHNYLYYKTFEEEAKRCGVYIGVENLKYGILPRPEYINRIIGMLDSPVYYPHVDIGHAALVGVEPEKFLKKLNCLPVRGIHVHDFNVQTDHMLPFLGKSDWDRIIKTLVDIGYEGDMTLEIFEICQMVASYSTDVLPALYNLTAEVGRELIRRIEEERKARV